MYDTCVTGGVGDARPGEAGPSWRERRVPPRHAPVWVHARGAWRKGRITNWIAPSQPGAGWECVIVAEPAPGDPPWQGRYIYDPQTIRPRHGGSPPARLLGGLRGCRALPPALAYLPLTRRSSVSRQPGHTLSWLQTGGRGNDGPGKGPRGSVALLGARQLRDPGSAAGLSTS